MKVAALDRMSRSLTEVLELLGWLRENGVEIISLQESIDQDSAMGRAMLHLAIVFEEMERDPARERTLAGLERVKATGKHLGRRKGISRKRVQRLMRIMGLRGIYQSPRISRPEPEHWAYPYLLGKIRIIQPNQAWAADITYLPMARGFLYLVAIMDWHSRYVVAWRLSNSLEPTSA